MVLSNKRLKQKLRSLLAESVAAAKTGKPPRDGAGADDVKRQLQGLKELLSSKNYRRARPTRRGGKRKKPSPLEDPKPAEAGAEKQEEGGGVGASEGSNEKKKKGKKRKRGEKGEEATESAEQKQQKQVRVEEGEEEKKKGKKKKRKKREEGEDNGEGVKDWREHGRAKGGGKEKKKKRKKKKEGESNEKGFKSGNEDGGADGGRILKKETENAAIDTSEENGGAMRKVYVGGIPYYSTEDDVRSFFEGCGTVTEVDCMTFPESGKFRGIAILTFKTEAAAKRALVLDSADMGGLYLKIQPYKAIRTQKTDFAPEVIYGYNRIYAGNLSWDIAEDDLRKLFSECKISSIRFGEDKVTGEFKGYAHVDFDDSSSLALALKLDQTVVCGRPVRIRCAVPKKGTETKLAPKTASKSVKDGSTSSGGAKKKKRQTCYECGVPGHLSSSCPQKKPVETASGSG